MRRRLSIVNVAHKSAEALLAILNDILDLSKIEAGKLNLEEIPYDLREIVNDLVVLYALKAEQKGVGLNSQVDEALPAVVIGDPTRMRQILVNLISNALKFTAEGEVSIRIGITRSTMIMSRFESRWPIAGSVYRRINSNSYFLPLPRQMVPLRENMVVQVLGWLSSNSWLR